MPQLFSLPLNNYYWSTLHLTQPWSWKSFACSVPAFWNLLKVAFIQKGLMNLSFFLTDELNYFPELRFGIFFVLNGSNHVGIRTWSCSNALFKPFRMKTNFKITAQQIFLRKMIWFICFEKWQIHQHYLNKSHLYFWTKQNNS